MLRIYLYWIVCSMFSLSCVQIVKVKSTYCFIIDLNTFLFFRLLLTTQYLSLSPLTSITPMFLGHITIYYFDRMFHFQLQLYKYKCYKIVVWFRYISNFRCLSLCKLTKNVFQSVFRCSVKIMGRIEHLFSNLAFIIIDL